MWLWKCLLNSIEVFLRLEFFFQLSKQIGGDKVSERESHLKIMMMMLLGGQLLKKVNFWMALVNEGLLFKMIIFETKYFSPSSLLRWFVEKALTINHAQTNTHLNKIESKSKSPYIFQNSGEWLKYPETFVLDHECE